MFLFKYDAQTFLTHIPQTVIFCNIIYEYICSVELSLKGKHLLLQVEMGTLELKQTLTGHRGRVWNVCWHPNGTCLASCGEDKTIIIWGQQDSKWVVKTILTEGHTRTIREIAWSPCGNYIASASFDSTTAVWDNKSGQFECNATLEGHENEVKSVSWSCSGHLLATCSRDKSVWIWEINDDEYECAAVINAHTQDVKKVSNYFMLLIILLFYVKYKCILLLYYQNVLCKYHKYMFKSL